MSVDPKVAFALSNPSLPDESPKDDDPTTKENPAPLDLPLPPSMALFIGLMQDIAQSCYGIKDYYLEEMTETYDDGSFNIQLRLKYNLIPNHHVMLIERAMRQFLFDLQTHAGQDNGVEINTHSCDIDCEDKMSLYCALEQLVNNLNEQAITPEDFIFEIHKPQREVIKQQISELIAHNAQLARKIAKRNPQLGEEMFFRVVSKPYGSLEQLDAAMCAASNAQISIPLTHLFKTICYEDKIPMRLIAENEFRFGGYN